MDFMGGGGEGVLHFRMSSSFILFHKWVKYPINIWFFDLYGFVSYHLISISYGTKMVQNAETC
jgi:hypothetical protein